MKEAGKEDQCRLAEPQGAGGCAREREGKPETEIKKQPQEENRTAEAAAFFPGGPTQQPPAVRVGGDSQARATRTAPWEEEEEETAPGWGLGLEVPRGQPGCHGHRDKDRL